MIRVPAEGLSVSVGSIVALAVDESVCAATIPDEGVCASCGKQRHKDELGRCATCGAGVCGMQTCDGNCKHE